MSAEKATSSFSSLVSRSVDKLSGKGGPFRQFVTKSDSGDNDDAVTATAERKKHRRAQVRKAQIEHRQRKQFYVRDLEQEVAKLREMIAAVQTEASAIGQDNAAIKTTLSACSIALPPNFKKGKNPDADEQSSSSRRPSHLSQQHMCSSDDSPNTNYAPKEETIDVSLLAKRGQIPLTFSNLSQISSSSQSMPATSKISMCFDDLIESRCLQISPTSNDATSSNIGAGSTADRNHHEGTSLVPSIPANSPGIKHEPGSVDPSLLTGPESTQPEADLTTIAINFILALEYPCRDHFYLGPQEWQSSDEQDFDGARGHEFMASTLVYSHAPDHVYADHAHAQWTIPTLQLSQLYAMSQSLEKDLLEITPVQAWFTLMDTYDIAELLKDGKLHVIKAGLAPLTQCVYYGAALDLQDFWDVVRGVMGSQDCVEP